MTVSEPWGLDRIVTELGFLEITRQESKRTIYCEPQYEHGLRVLVDQLGAADVFTVRVSPACPEGRLLIVDDGAFDAAEREWLQGLTRQPWKFGG
jgi:hypothetical protein